MLSDRSARYCRILGISPPATAEEVKRAYREMVLVWHPDRFGANPRLQAKAEERLREINEAFAALRDGVERGPERAPAPEAPPPPRAAPSADAPPVVIVHSAFPPPRRRFVLPRVVGLEALITLTVLAAFCGGAFWLLDFLRLPALPFADLPQPRLASTVLSAAIDDWAVRARSAIVPAQPVEPVLPPQPPAPQRSRQVKRQARGTQRNGAGSIRIANHTHLDCLATLAPEAMPAAAARILNVKAGAAAVLDGIGPGSFMVSVQFAGKGARVGPLGPFHFWQIESAQGIKSDSYEIVLEPR